MTTDRQVKDMLIAKANALIAASYNLELIEQRLIFLAIIEARESGLGISADDPLTIHASSYAENFDVTIHGAYSALKEAVELLFKRQFSYESTTAKGKKEYIKTRWISEIRYIPDEAVVKLIFAPSIVPLITRLEEQFTTYELAQVSKLSSKYSTRLYELLMQWKSVGKTPVYEVNDFRNKLGVGINEYKLTANFKARVLDLAVAQINECTDISLEYSQTKKGRSIFGYSFTFKNSQKASKTIENKHDPDVDLFTKMTDKQRHLFSNKLSELPDMNKYSQGTESYAQFAVRIAEMLQDKERFKELLPYLRKVGFNTK